MREDENFLGRVKERTTSLLRSMTSDGSDRFERRINRTPDSLITENHGLVLSTSYLMTLSIDTIFDYMVGNVDIPSVDTFMNEHGTLKLASFFIAKGVINVGSFVGSMIWSYFYFDLHSGDFK